MIRKIFKKVMSQLLLNKILPSPYLFGKYNELECDKKFFLWGILISLENPRLNA